MKKFALVLLVLLLIAGIAACVIGYRFNQTYGWLAAPPVSHEKLATADTRLRVSVDTILLGEKLQVYLPPALPVPGWLPWDLGELLPRVLPREVALLGGSDFRDGKFGLTMFVNEQRGGPILPDYLNTQSGFKESLPQIVWDGPGFALAERGVLTASGHLELPMDLEESILQNWSLDPPGDQLALLGGHVAEAVFDNRNGDILTLIAACAPIWGTSLEQLRQNSQFEAAIALLAQVFDIRLAADFKNPDVLLIQLRINAEPDVGGQLEFMGPFVLSMLATDLQRRHDLVMVNEYAWLPEEHTYKVDISITGIEKKLKDQFRTWFPAATGATPAEAPRAAR